MDIRVFRPLTGNESLESGQLGKLRAHALTWTENLYEPGAWSMSLSGFDNYARTLAQGNLISVKESGLYLWGVIRGVDDAHSANSFPIIRSGNDLKGYLKQRICMYPDSGELPGYDAVMGSTEAVMKHYIFANAASPISLARKIPGLTVAADQGRGIPDDKYMARFQPLHEVLQEVGAAQELGWKVAMDIASGQMIADVIQGIDRTAEQSDRPRVVLDVNLRTAANSRFISNTENYRNVFYTTKSGARSEAEATTLQFFREGEPEPSGINRFETQIGVDVATDSADITGEMRNLAQKSATGFDRDDAFSVELNGNHIYNKEYFLGDFVTVRDSFMARMENVQLVSVVHEWNGNGYRLTGTFGKPRKSNLELLERQIRTGGK